MTPAIVADFDDLIKYQNMLARQVAKQANTDRKIKLLQAAARLAGPARKKVQTAVLVHDAEIQGFSESEAYAVIEALEHDGLLQKAGEGYLKVL